MFLHGIEHAALLILARLSKNPAVQSHLDAEIDKVIDNDLGDLPAEFHPIVKRYAHRAIHRVENRAAEIADPTHPRHTP